MTLIQEFEKDGDLVYGAFFSQTDSGDDITIETPTGRQFANNYLEWFDSLPQLRAATVGRWSLTRGTQAAAFTLRDIATGDFPDQPELFNPPVVPREFEIDMGTGDFALVSSTGAGIDPSFLFTFMLDEDQVRVPILPGFASETFELNLHRNEVRSPADFLRNASGDFVIADQTFNMQTRNFRDLTASVPEPTSVIVSMGCCGLLLLRSRRRLRSSNQAD